MTRRSWARLPFLAVNLAGVLAFAAPFLVAAGPEGEAGARSGDAPWLLALLVPLTIAVAITEAGGARMDAKRIALLGVLAGFAAVLRLPVSFAGANLIFLVPIAGGFVFGTCFGFLLGALAMAASAAITGGIGPWLPFQMWAMGWVGAGAGALRPLADRLVRRRRVGVVLLASYGYAAAFLYGAVMNLYFWPVAAVGPAAIGWTPGLGPAEAWRHYRAFYATTSLGWDAIGAGANALALLVAGGPIVELLRRYRRRFSYRVELGTAGEEPGPEPEIAGRPLENAG